MIKEQRRFTAALAVAGMLLVLSGCASNPTDPNDPLEGVNRDFDAINSHLDANLLEPVSDVYVEYIPGEMRQGVTNFFDNLATPNDVLNSFLQGKLGDAASGAEGA